MFNVECLILRGAKFRVIELLNYRTNELSIFRNLERSLKNNLKFLKGASPFLKRSVLKGRRPVLKRSVLT